MTVSLNVEVEPEARRQASLGARALQATAWIVAAKPLGMAIQLARSLILTRLLFPEAFGLMAIVSAVTQGLQMCSDVGIEPSIVRSRRGDDVRFLRTAWTLQILRGLCLWTICCACAWPASIVYREPKLLAILPVAGLNAVISGFGTTAWPLHDRAMKRKRITLINLIAPVLNLFVLVLTALWLRSVWALVIGGLCGSFMYVILGHLFLPGVRHRIHWDRAAAHELIHFGKWVFISTLLTFLAMQLDKLMLGRLIPMGLLGVYSISLVLANLPRELVEQISTFVLFPLLSEKVRGDPACMDSLFHRSRDIVLRIGLILCLGAAFVAPCFFNALYDHRYASASWMAQLLAFSAWLTILNTTTGSALLAFGDSKALAIGNLVNAVVTVMGALVGFHALGLPGFILGYACGTAAGEVVQGLRIRRYGVTVLRHDIVLSAFAAGVGVFYVYATTLVEAHHVQSPVFLRTALGVALWFGVCAVLLPGMKQQLAIRLGRVEW